MPIKDGDARRSYFRDYMRKRRAQSAGPDPDLQEAEATLREAEAALREAEVAWLRAECAKLREQLAALMAENEQLRGRVARTAGGDAGSVSAGTRDARVTECEVRERRAAAKRDSHSGQEFQATQCTPQSPLRKQTTSHDEEAAP